MARNMFKIKFEKKIKLPSLPVAIQARTPSELALAEQMKQVNTII